MHFNAPVSDGVDHRMHVDMDDLPNLEQFVTRPPACLPHYREIFEDVMMDFRLAMPTSLTEAAELYAAILDALF